MSGLEVVNDWGMLQVSTEAYPLTLIKSMLVEVRNLAAGRDFYVSASLNIELSHDDIVFIHHVGPAYVGRWWAGYGSFVNSDINEGPLVIAASAPVTVEVYICRLIYQYPAAPATSGLELYDDNDTLVFSTAARLIGIVDAFSPADRSTGALASSKCAIANSTDAVYYTYQNPSSYYWTQGFQMSGGNYHIAILGYWDPYSQGYNLLGYTAEIAAGATQSPVLVIDVTTLPLPFG